MLSLLIFAAVQTSAVEPSEPLRACHARPVDGLPQYADPEP